MTDDYFDKQPSQPHFLFPPLCIDCIWRSTVVSDFCSMDLSIVWKLGSYADTQIKFIYVCFIFFLYMCFVMMVWTTSQYIFFQ